MPFIGMAFLLTGSVTQIMAVLIATNLFCRMTKVSSNEALLPK